MSDAFEAVLRGAGLTDKPGEFDSSIHSWRCEHPETYGPCDCFQELVRELAEVGRAAAARALEEAADGIESRRNEPGLVHLDVRYAGYYTGIRSGMESDSKALRARAAEIREGKLT